jgi:hypothetical protein
VQSLGRHTANLGRCNTVLHSEFERQLVGYSQTMRDALFDKEGIFPQVVCDFSHGEIKRPLWVLIYLSFSCRHMITQASNVLPHVN